jgi:hypothetical protein
MPRCCRRNLLVTFAPGSDKYPEVCLLQRKEVRAIDTDVYLCNIYINKV